MLPRKAPAAEPKETTDQAGLERAPSRCVPLPASHHPPTPIAKMFEVLHFDSVFEALDNPSRSDDGAMPRTTSATSDTRSAGNDAGSRAASSVVPTAHFVHVGLHALPPNDEEALRACIEQLEFTTDSYMQADLLEILFKTRGGDLNIDGTPLSQVWSACAGRPGVGIGGLTGAGLDSISLFFFHSCSWTPTTRRCAHGSGRSCVRRPPCCSAIRIRSPPRLSTS